MEADGEAGQPTQVLGMPDHKGPTFEGLANMESCRHKLGKAEHQIPFPVFQELEMKEERAAQSQRPETIPGCLEDPTSKNLELVKECPPLPPPAQTMAGNLEIQRRDESQSEMPGFHASKVPRLM